MQYRITKQEINEKPLLEYTGPLTLVRAQEDLVPALQAMSSETLLGFDTETRPAFRKGEAYLPSVLQLAGESHVWIFQIRLLESLAELLAVLADPGVQKVGAAVARDVQELRDLSSFRPAGFADVGHMAEKRGFRNTGLRPLTALLLGHRISKGAQVSNWAAAELTDKQLTYAATDAWVSRKIYLALRDLPEQEDAPKKNRPSKNEKNGESAAPPP